MRINLTKSDVIWSYIGTVISMGANFVMLPFLLCYLDSDSLGLWYVFASIGAIATLLDMGFAVSFARNITYCWTGARELKKENVSFITNTDPDFDLIKNILFTCRLIYGFISVIALIFLSTIGTLYIKYVSQDLYGNNLFVSWFIYIVAVFLNLYFGYYSSFLRGVGAIDLVNKDIVIARTVQIMLTIFLLVIGCGLVGVCFSYLVYGITFRILGKYYFLRFNKIGEKLEKIKTNYCKKKVIDLLDIVWHNAWRDGVISISNYMLNQASTIICSLCLSLSETGVFSVGVQITSALSIIAGTLYNAYQPEIQSAYIVSDIKKTQRVMSLIVMSFIYLYILGCILFILIGIPILRMIKPSFVIEVPVLIGLCVYQFLLKFRNCYTSYFSCTNRVIYVKAFVFSSFLCILVALFLTGYLNMGVWGLVIAQISSQLIFNAWYWPLLAHKEMNINFKQIIVQGTVESISLLKGFLCN